ncbi:probable galacturonosyltransferase 7 isoform X2 [Vigna unguiculata]|uniref:probable galacturonosyltransferase 7 isoform X2 n=1 Tax=Vigna unguiculata TaxID=3917 RepID=UPI0010160489|nr:probable galacturonosyltransferase 7 isoform X2 [Vigna unguiculata]
MKSGGLGAVPSYGVPAKRRWRGLVIAVLGLVILSMLVPLVFLLGLHNGFHSSGYVYEQKNSPSVEQSSHVKELMTQFEPTLPKNVVEQYAHEGKNDTIDEAASDNKQRGGSTDTIDRTASDDKQRVGSPDTVDRTASDDKQRVGSPDTIDRTASDDKQRGGSANTIDKTAGDGKQRGSKVPPNDVLQSPPTSNNPGSDHVEQATHPKTSSTDEDRNSCEVTFGSYCLWQQEHRQEMKETLIKKLKDQLFVTRAYYPSIAKLPAKDKLSRQLKQNIQEMEHMLSESTSDADLPPVAESYSKKMENTITRIKSVALDCNNVDKKLRQIFDLTEDEAKFHMKQSAFLYKLNVLTMPKSLHCLSLKLTVEYFKSPQYEEKANEEKFTDSSLQHYVIFSNNVLAASVVINSTVYHAKESVNQVFHVLTDRENYYAMKLWFLRNQFKKAAVQVLNVEQDSQMELPEEFWVSFRGYDNPSTNQIRTEYLSIFSDSHYLLPDLFSNLKKVVVLDDDVVIQQDLSALWNIDLGDKVNGAVQFCSVKLGQLRSYLGQKGFSHNSCAWMSGLNIIDLGRWRELGLTQTYKKLIKELTKQEGSAEGIAWRASLLAFENRIHPLDKWVVSGLGHNYTIESQSIKTAPVLHYNGKMKPWLDLGIPQYKSYWKKFLNKEDQLLSECNVNS